MSDLETIDVPVRQGGTTKARVFGRTGSFAVTAATGFKTGLYVVTHVPTGYTCGDAAFIMRQRAEEYMAKLAQSEQRCPQLWGAQTHAAFQAMVRKHRAEFARVKREKDALMKLERGA